MKKILTSLTLIFLLMDCGEKISEITSEEGKKEINGTQLYVKMVGQGEPLLIIHGGPGLNHQYLYSHLEKLKAKFLLIFYDQRACGQSSLEVDNSTVTLDNFIEDIEWLRQSVGIDKMNILAHSWGGILGMKYAVKYPGNLKSLILVNSVGASSAIDALSNNMLMQRFTSDDSIRRAEVLQSEAFQKREPAAIEALMKVGYKLQFYDKTLLDSLHLSIDENFSRTSQLLQNLSNDLTDYDFHEALKKISCPTLLLYGSYDPLAETAAPQLEQAIGGAQLRLIDQSGHFPFIEQPKTFRKIVEEFVFGIGE